MSDSEGSVSGAEEEPGDDSQWRFTLEDIEVREAEAEAEREAEMRRNEPLEPGNPSLESAAFVLLGVALALFLLSRLVIG
ncbi:MAG: hypothetical protein ACI8UR_002453 [Natronomonas sp.]|jgi:hypothetical protein|uniref:DUF7312 domain-containing protein n=1 Tax=Natronomonas sp. TaxID=2184060 RepID=UPI003989AC91